MTAYVTGTATDHLDLYNQLYAFLTANADLVNAGEAWTEEWTHPDAAHPVVGADSASQFLLRGPGLAGGDNIYVSFNLHADATNDVYGVALCGHDGVLDTSLAYDDHINTSPRMWTPAFSSAMPYWFVANGRRFVAIWKCSTVYEACYGGLGLAFSTPAGYPYPLVIGGSSETYALRYSVDTWLHTNFVDPGPRDKTSEDAFNSSATGGRSLLVRLPGGSWQYFDNGDYNGQRATTYPWAGAGLIGNNFLEQARPLLGGGYLLSPVTTIIDRSEAKGALMALDGVYHVPGIGNAAEDLITVGGVDHLVVQNAYRSDFEGFWALALD
ncbi:hypothetical protein [Halomonas stenophila]|uniref:Virion structural protein n=1 Tax=Halomonas stenophila TaxID=795312 RepID=A0A7W5HLM2_9GAMM|nr:hypothetical protein [Halomonas stenophila]MBB3231701.1 hypothetical protein [Halomonas stenophila]